MLPSNDLELVPSVRVRALRGQAVLGRVLDLGEEASIREDVAIARERLGVVEVLETPSPRGEKFRQALEHWTGVLSAGLPHY